MIEPGKAEEHLRLIRHLMERATIYRAISAPTALFGGGLATAVALWFLLTAPGDGSTFGLEQSVRGFTLIWMIVLVATLCVNTWYIARKAHREKTALLSPGLRLAIRCAIPPVGSAAILTLFILRDEGAAAMSLLVAAIWILFYGLALLATSTFAPRSLVLLGAAFVVAGLVTLLMVFGLWQPPLRRPAMLAMGLTFGIFHLVYAACAWPRPGGEIEPNE